MFCKPVSVFSIEPSSPSGFFIPWPLSRAYLLSPVSYHWESPDPKFGSPTLTLEFQPPFHVLQLFLCKHEHNHQPLYSFNCIYPTPWIWCSSLKSTRLVMGRRFPPISPHPRLMVGNKPQWNADPTWKLPLPSVTHRKQQIVIWKFRICWLSLLDTQVLLWLSWTERRDQTPMRLILISVLYNFCQGTLSRTRLSLFFLDFSRRCMKLALEGQYLLTCLSPIYLPNEKNVKKQILNVWSVWQEDCERESAGKGLNINTLPWFLLPVNGAQVQTLAGITH